MTKDGNSSRHLRNVEAKANGGRGERMADLSVPHLSDGLGQEASRCSPRTHLPRQSRQVGHGFKMLRPGLQGERGRVTRLPG